MNILAFGASASATSINASLARFAASLVPRAQVEALDLRDFALPLYSEDLEREIGIPEAARAFFERIGGADGIVVSFAEHNGSYTAAWKNLFDWMSRIDRQVFQGRPAVYLATSPGPGGAGNVLAAAKGSARFFGADLKAAVSVPRFYEAFDRDAGRITDPAVLAQLTEAAEALAAPALA